MRRTQKAAFIMPLMSCRDINEALALVVYGIGGATAINNDFAIASQRTALIEAAPLLT